MKRVLGTIVCMLILTVVVGCGEKKSKQQQLEQFIEAHLSKIKPLIKEMNLAYWQAANSGKEDDYNKAGELQLKLRQIYSNKEEFSFLKNVRESGQVTDSLLVRQMDKLYNAYLENQIDPELMKRIVELGTKV
jgi:peptidyl-dipeptidase A